jgi:hypothetical protein
MRRTILIAVAGLAGLAACTPPEGAPVNIASDPRTEQVEIDGYTYFVLIDGPRASISNFATGMPDPLVLMDGARAALASGTDCAVTDFFKLKNANRYQATLVC